MKLYSVQGVVRTDFATTATPVSYHEDRTKRDREAAASLEILTTVLHDNKSLILTSNGDKIPLTTFLGLLGIRGAGIERGEHKAHSPIDVPEGSRLVLPGDGRA